MAPARHILHPKSANDSGASADQGENTVMGGPLEFLAVIWLCWFQPSILYSEAAGPPPPEALRSLLARALSPVLSPRMLVDSQLTLYVRAQLLGVSGFLPVCNWHAANVAQIPLESLFEVTKNSVKAACMTHIAVSKVGRPPEDPYEDSFEILVRIPATEEKKLRWYFERAVRQTRPCFFHVL